MKGKILKGLKSLVIPYPVPSVSLSMLFVGFQDYLSFIIDRHRDKLSLYFLIYHRKQNNDSKAVPGPFVSLSLQCLYRIRPVICTESKATPELITGSSSTAPLRQLLCRYILDLFSYANMPYAINLQTKRLPFYGQFSVGPMAYNCYISSFNVQER